MTPTNATTLDTTSPHLSNEHREIFVEAAEADSLKDFFAANGVGIVADCRDVEAVLHLGADCDLERVASLLIEWSAKTQRRPHRWTAQGEVKRKA